MVYGGKISFCLYMVHELVHTSWGWAVEQFELVTQDNPWKWNVIGLLAIALAGAVVLYHGVEEPAAGGCARWSTCEPSAREATRRTGQHQAASDRPSAGSDFGRAV
ncbi:putative MEMBRANE ACYLTRANSFERASE domain protein [Mycobacterium avium MAV_120809_2495]|nr:putative MEMBRANE ACYLTRANSFERASE domain protein [Mycobacterium avium MAV_120809_2495]